MQGDLVRAPEDQLDELGQEQPERRPQRQQGAATGAPVQHGDRDLEQRDQPQRPADRAVPVVPTLEEAETLLD